MIDFVLNVATNKNNVYYLIISTIIFFKKNLTIIAIAK